MRQSQSHLIHYKCLDWYQLIRSRNALINGDTENYDWDQGYTCHQLGSGAIVVQLAQPYLLSSIRMLLWDCDYRHYSYYVETSLNNWDWEMVCDRTRESCRSWQVIYFKPRPVSIIRIVGTNNSVNENSALLLTASLVGLPRWSSGRKCDCRTRGLGFNSRVGQSITGLFRIFEKFLGSSTESGIVSRIWQ
ncbi:hypothetical protein SFRURICE_017717 [Spodoptera frugiperda]|nr:hypothetical protein SFRURICE_017717 [Spodoptera frugiperda]